MLQREERKPRESIRSYSWGSQRSAQSGRRRSAKVQACSACPGSCARCPACPRRAARSGDPPDGTSSLCRKCSRPSSEEVSPRSIRPGRGNSRSGSAAARQAPAWRSRCSGRGRRSRSGPSRGSRAPPRRPCSQRTPSAARHRRSTRPVTLSRCISSSARKFFEEVVTHRETMVGW